jgi:hypothetical protein
MFWDVIMPRITHSKRSKQSIEAQIALSKRVLKGLHKSIDAKLDEVCDLEVEHALALYKAGKATLLDAEEVMQQARRRVG